MVMVGSVEPAFGCSLVGERLARRRPFHQSINELLSVPSNPLLAFSATFLSVRVYDFSIGERQRALQPGMRSPAKLF